MTSVTSLYEAFKKMSPLARTLELARNARTYCDALGAEKYFFTGIDRLCTVPVLTFSLSPLNTIETLIANAEQPFNQPDSLLTHFPQISAREWAASFGTGGLRYTSIFQQPLLPNQLLALYQFAAWKKTLGTWGRPDASAAINAWIAAPFFVQNDSMMQHIMALKCPVVMQECIQRSPQTAWDTHAIALSLKHTDLSMQMPWYQLLDDASFTILLTPDGGNHPVLGKHLPHLYQFPVEKLSVLQGVNPALFIHGVSHNRNLRESPMAVQWFVPMLEASFKKVLNNPVYMYDFLKPRNASIEQANRFDAVLEQFAPSYTRLLLAYQALHEGDAAYTHWAQGCARALMSPEQSINLPDLDDASPSSD